MAKKIDTDKLLQKKIPDNCIKAEEILKLGGYIKGYYQGGRLMDKNHSPVLNISQSDLDWLKVHNYVRQENYVFILNEVR